MPFEELAPLEDPAVRAQRGDEALFDCGLWPEGFRGPCYEHGSQWLDSTHGCQFIPTPAELRRRPSEGGLRVFGSLRGCHLAVAAREDVQRIGNARQLVQIQPSAPIVPVKL